MCYPALFVDNENTLWMTLCSTKAYFKATKSCDPRYAFFIRTDQQWNSCGGGICVPMSCFFAVRHDSFSNMMNSVLCSLHRCSYLSVSVWNESCLNYDAVIMYFKSNQAAPTCRKSGWVERGQWVDCRFNPLTYVGRSEIRSKEPITKQFKNTLFGTKVSYQIVFSAPSFCLDYSLVRSSISSSRITCPITISYDAVSCRSSKFRLSTSINISVVNRSIRYGDCCICSF